MKRRHLSATAMAERITQLAVPAQQLERPPQRPVGDPDMPPMGLDLFGGAMPQAATRKSGPGPRLPTDD